MVVCSTYQMPKKGSAPTRQPSDSFRRELEQGIVPEMTDELALVYAKLLSVGCPPILAVLYCAPELRLTDQGKEAAKRIAAHWTSDALVLAAVDNINGGKWHELPIEKRLELARAKSDAEAAFYLWTTNFSTVEHTEGLAKMKMAREMVKGALGEAPDESDPMAAFARFAMELAKNTQAQSAAKSRKPTQVQNTGLDKLLNTVPEGRVS